MKIIVNKNEDDVKVGKVSLRLAVILWTIAPFLWYYPEKNGACILIFLGLVCFCFTILMWRSNRSG